MSGSSNTKITTETTPKVSHQNLETPAIAKTETGTMVAVNQPLSPTQTEENSDNSLAALTLFVPFIFLIAVVAILIERLIKWGLRRFFFPKPAFPVAAAYHQMATLE